ncbi:PXA domain-containing protein [Crucibulum laeve]|uniref:PXA domain-containing protein n=1 Tax=Crucibulum laeve TaxID=68775 RepID=A0A5C3M940_9AGAR|nr:PXA domain-containing protein [Crucibulum laeve]
MSLHSRNHPKQPSVLSAQPRTVQQPLAKRLLFPSNTGDALPPLLNSQDLPPEVTAELYDFIALALRAFVNPWWTKITRYDKEFLPQVSRIIETVVRELESRLQTLDLPPLAFHDIPAIITQHYADYRSAASKVSSSYANGGAMSLPQLFHQHQPHMAISADGQLNHEYFRQVIDHILKSCLPPEDYEPDSERYIVREVVLKVLLNDVLPKIVQPWFIHKTMLDLLGPSEDEPDALSQEGTSPPSSPLSIHTLLVVVLSALQAFSGACLALIHAYKQAISTIKFVNQSSPRLAAVSSKIPSTDRLERTTSSQRVHPPPSSPCPSTSSSTSSIPSRATLPSLSPVPHASYAYSGYFETPFLMLTEIFSARERFVSNIAMTIISMIMLSATPFLDKLLPYLLSTTLSPSFILNIIRLSKRTLFPNGYPGPQPPDPTAEEQAELRARLLAWKGRSSIAYIFPFILGPEPSRTLDAALEPLSSAPCNTHLLIMIFDRLIAGMFPELCGL